MSLPSATQCGVEPAVRLRNANPEFCSAIEAELVPQRRAGDADGGQKQAGDGNPALAARGFGDAKFDVVAVLLGDVLQPHTDNRLVTTLSHSVRELADAHPCTRATAGERPCR
ncbi:MAG: hypothetical protein B5766_10780 [Candidatus Lumbricidophila eiseniae]|uniref:Uncharacterized protein n=1 Tax=Candidatus Lumbricidiphila eiseniae TaxID=1969409 RepID=A0A2A6FPK3_9MICO|nr:MAG: hypothetical protein B5766_10780 [Candidatus Lumbricidophila eiseniae]